MLRSLLAMVLVTGAAAVGCTSQAPPRSPAAETTTGAQVQSDQKAKPRRLRTPLVAPPPAYGNRVVLLDVPPRDEPASECSGDPS